MTKDELRYLCRIYNIHNYTIRKDAQGFLIDVHDDVMISWEILIRVPIRFGVVNGDLCLSSNEIVDMSSDFDIICNEVTGHFDCSFNKLTTLRGCPSKVGGKFFCFGNELPIEAYHYLFDLGYEAEDIVVDDCDRWMLVTSNRQWILNKLINE